MTMLRFLALFLTIPCVLSQKVAVVDVQKVFDGYQKVKARERLEKSSKIAKEKLIFSGMNLGIL